MKFVNREDELRRLEHWWTGAQQGSMAVVWGRRRNSHPTRYPNHGGTPTTRRRFPMIAPSSSDRPRYVNDSGPMASVPTNAPTIDTGADFVSIR